MMESIHFWKVKFAEMSVFEETASVRDIRLNRVSPKTANWTIVISLIDVSGEAGGRLLNSAEDAIL